MSVDPTLHVCQLDPESGHLMNTLSVVSDRYAGLDLRAAVAPIEPRYRVTWGVGGVGRLSGVE